MKNNNKDKGFTLVEILIAFAVLGLMMTFLFPILSYSKRAGKTMTRLDSYHDIRRVDYEISSELKLGSSVLYPPSPSGSGTSDWYSQVLFRNSLNQIQLVYLNESNKLIFLNYDNLKGSYLANGKILGSNIKEFSVRRHGSSVVEYKLTFEAENKDFIVSNRIALVNIF